MSFGILREREGGGCKSRFGIRKEGREFGGGRPCEREIVFLKKNKAWGEDWGEGYQSFAQISI